MNSVISECDGIIYSIASKYKNMYNIEDLFQVGYIGVLKAYKNFNSKLNIKFTTYAYNYILGEIINYIKNDRNIKVSDDYFSIYKRYENIRNFLRNKYMREPSMKEIALFMEVDEYKLYEILEKTAFTKNIEYDMSIPDYQVNNNIVNKLILDEEIDKLDEPERSIIRYRYYFDMSQEETAKMINISQAKVSRCEGKALKLMKKNII